MSFGRIYRLIGFSAIVAACVDGHAAGTRGQAEIELVGPGVISTDANETFPAEDPMDGSLWFSVYDRSFAGQTIMRAERRGDSWSAREVAPFSGAFGDRAPRFSPGGSRLYFTSNRPAEAGAEAGDMNIWMVERTSSGWSDPVRLPDPVNTEHQEIHGAATPNALWFASDRPTGHGRSDIYRVTLSGGSWGEITHLPPVINTDLSQPDLWVSEDETLMVFAMTDHPDGLGGDDLFASRFDGTSWSAPRHLGEPINSAEYEYGPTLSADGEYLYFTSHRSGSADVYRVRLAAITAMLD